MKALYFIGLIFCLTATTWGILELFFKSNDLFNKIVALCGVIGVTLVFFVGISSKNIIVYNKNNMIEENTIAIDGSILFKVFYINGKTVKEEIYNLYKLSIKEQS